MTRETTLPLSVAAFEGINRLGSAPALEPKLEPAQEVGVVV